jgi:NitT/TauT family transport system ATP-binding protein
MFLQIDKLNKHFATQNGTLVVLKDIDMAIAQGEFICAVGASGSGKSTLLRQIAGLDSPTTGEVKVDGKRVTAPGPDRGMVFQHYTLYPWMTVQANTELLLECGRTGKLCQSLAQRTIGWHETTGRDRARLGFRT